MVSIPDIKKTNSKSYSKSSARKKVKNYVKYILFFQMQTLQSLVVSNSLRKLTKSVNFFFLIHYQKLKIDEAAFLLSDMLS